MALLGPSALDDDTLARIFSRVQLQDIVTLAPVCKRWKRILEDQQVPIQTPMQDKQGLNTCIRQLNSRCKRRVRVQACTSTVSMREWTGQLPHVFRCFVLATCIRVALQQKSRYIHIIIHGIELLVCHLEPRGDGMSARQLASSN